MNENMNSAETPEPSGYGKFCKMCGCGHGYHRHFWLRWLLGLIILGLVFCVGVKVGEFKSEFGGAFGMRGGHHTRYFFKPIMQGYPGVMMNQGGYMMSLPKATTTPAK